MQLNTNRKSNKAAQSDAKTAVRNFGAAGLKRYVPEKEQPGLNAKEY